MRKYTSRSNSMIHKPSQPIALSLQNRYKSLSNDLQFPKYTTNAQRSTNNLTRLADALLCQNNITYFPVSSGFMTGVMARLSAISTIAAERGTKVGIVVREIEDVLG